MSASIFLLGDGKARHTQFQPLATLPLYLAAGRTDGADCSFTGSILIPSPLLIWPSCQPGGKCPSSPQFFFVFIYHDPASGSVRALILRFSCLLPSPTKSEQLSPLNCLKTFDSLVTYPFIQYTYIHTHTYKHM